MPIPKDEGCMFEIVDDNGVIYDSHDQQEMETVFLD